MKYLLSSSSDVKDSYSSASFSSTNFFNAEVSVLVNESIKCLNPFVNICCYIYAASYLETTTFKES